MFGYELLYCVDYQLLEVSFGSDISMFNV